MSNCLSYDDVVRMWRSLPVFPEVKTSEFVPRGTGYRLAIGEHGREVLLVHPDDWDEMRSKDIYYGSE